MSRQPQLPPRCPISKTKSLDSASSITYKDENHLKSASQSFVLEEQPAWLDDLLGDWDSGFKSKSHRRAARDSVTILNDFVELPSLNTEENGATILESSCIYGPNSPRAKEKMSIQENAILSEYASHGPQLNEFNMEDKPFKRHSAQRSRGRKLQYIAELERTVENLQSIVSELVVRVNTTVEQRVYLSVENKQLKQQLARLQEENFVIEREYQCMRNEAEVLKRCVAFSRNGSKVRTDFRLNSSGDSEILQAWSMIDMGRLHIN